MKVDGSLLTFVRNPSSDGSTITLLADENLKTQPHPMREMMSNTEFYLNKFKGLRSGLGGFSFGFVIVFRK